MKKLIFALTVVLASTRVVLAADIDPKLEAAIREKAAEVLFDAESARFTFDIVREVNELGGKVCGTVNAKNRLGAYTGRKFFLAGYMKLGDDYLILAFSPSDYSLEAALTESSICD